MSLGIAQSECRFRLLQASRIAAVCLMLSVPGAVPAQDESPEAPVSAPQPVSAEELNRLLTDLNSNDFRTRNAATRRLTEIGTPAIAPVAQAAEKGDLELATRAVSILEELFKSKDAATKAAAEAALKKLTESSNRSVAQRAAAVIEEPEPAEAQGNNVRIQLQVIGGAGGRIQIRGGNIQIGGGGNAEREFSADVEGKKVSVKETIGKNIEVKVTEKTDDGEKTETYKADNAADLQQKHPEIFKLYTQAQRQQLRQQFQARPLPAVIPAIPAPAGGNARIQIQDVNGAREIQIEENGKSVQISDNNGKNIVVKTTETVDGKEKTTEVKAADLDDLKKKSPEAAKLYEKYTAGAGGAVIQGIGGFGGIGGNIQIQALPAQAIPVLPAQIQRLLPQAVPDQPANEAAPNIPEATQRISRTIEDLKAAGAAGKLDRETVDRLVKELVAAQEALQGAKAVKP